MAALLERARVQLTLHQPPVAGLLVARFDSEGHLFRSVPDRGGAVLTLAGRAEWTVRNIRGTSRPGSIDLKVAHEVHADRARHGRSRLQVVLFDNDLLGDARAALELQPGAPITYALAPSDPHARALAALHHHVLDDAPADVLEQATTAAVAAYATLTSAMPPRGYPASAYRAAVHRARAMLDERITETVPLAELAAHARLDKFRLCRAFRDEVGLPPHAYVTLRRMGLAQQLLARGLSQAEVATRIGLYDQSQLHRHFKRSFGLTPGEYVRAAR